MEKLFKPFGQAKSFSRSEEKGTGLGLALSRKLARLHGGEISLISEKGKGSCFTLTMPLNPNKY
jgi:signal transduction histidine kinase